MNPFTIRHNPTRGDTRRHNPTYGGTRRPGAHTPRPQANEIFVPKTISNCMPLANEGTSVVACVIDLQDRHYVWADVEADRATATVENANSRTVEVMKALVFNTKMTVHDLLILHAQQRGTIATDPNSADLALRWEGFVTDYAKVAGYMDL